MTSMLRHRGRTPLLTPRQAPLTGQPRLWTSHSTGPGMANSALADEHARRTFHRHSLPTKSARGRTREMLMASRLTLPFAPASTDARGRSHETNSQLARTHPFALRKGTPQATSARGRSRETNFAGTSSCPERSRTATQDAQGLGTNSAFAAGWHRRSRTVTRDTFSAGTDSPLLPYDGGPIKHRRSRTGKQDDTSAGPARCQDRSRMDTQDEHISWRSPTNSC